MKIEAQEKKQENESVKRLPVLFIGHGSPMNAIADNLYTRSLAELGQRIARPKAILCISAHWMTEDTRVTRMLKPKTIHDFYGFPKPLFDIQYPAPGSPEMADLIRAEVKAPTIKGENEAWGLDHGAWSVLKHMYPKADVPVLQLSVSIHEPPEYHFDLGNKLRTLRDQGVLIVGSGNIVHNLRQINFDPKGAPFDWALEFDEWVKEQLILGQYDALVSRATRSPAGKLSIPTPDHWYPLLYILGAADHQDQLQFEYEGIEHGSISMRSLSLSRV